MAFKKGSTIPDNSLRHIDCAHAPQCGHSAIIRERVATGWANFCWQHYMEHIERERMARWVAAGRPTKQQSLEKMRGLFIKDINSQQVFVPNVKLREPGQDDEERAAA